MDSNEKELLRKVHKKYKDIDIVVDLYCMQIVWASEKFSEKLGYKQKELYEKKEQERLR